MDNPFYATCASGKYTVWSRNKKNYLKENLSLKEAEDCIKTEMEKLQSQTTRRRDD